MSCPRSSKGGGQLLAQGIVAPSLVEAPLGAQPTDVVVTPDGDFAVVRSTAPPPNPLGVVSLDTDHLSVWDLQQRTRLPLFYPTTIPPGPAPGRGEFALGSEVSDLVETTNSLALCAGSAVVGATPTTFVDVLNLSTASTGSVNVVASLTRAATLGSQFPMGDVNDVAITPDERIGIVNHRNTVTFITLRQGTLRKEVDLSTIGVSPPLEVSPMGATDSIAVFGKKAVVISTRRQANGAKFPWVFIFDLTGTTVVNTYAAPFIDPSSAGQIMDFTSTARSVRITPDGTQAVLSADYIVSAVSLSAVPGAPTFPIGFLDTTDKDLRRYSTTRDSLEVTNTRAVTLANRLDTTTSRSWYRIRIFELSSGSFNPVFVKDSQFGPLDGVDDKAHDLAITPDGLTALVKTELANVVIQNLTGGINYVEARSAGNPLRLNPVVPSLPSDSVVITGSAAPFKGVVIGTAVDTLTGRNKGIVDFISLSGTPSTVTVSELDPAFEIRPMDLKVTLDAGKVCVRFEHQAGLAPGSGLGQAVILYNLTGTLFARFAASGDTFRLDDIEVGNNSVIGISESSPTAPNQQVVGHVQLIKF